MKRFALYAAPLLVSVCGESALDPHATAGIVSVSPARNVVTAPRDAEVTVTFADPVDPTSIHGSSILVYGRWSGPVGGTFTVTGDGTLVRFVPNQPFAAGEWVTVNVSRGVRRASGEPLEAAFAWGFFTRTSQGVLSQVRLGERTVRRPGEGLVQMYGAYAGDLNGDGYSDLIVPNEQTNDARVLLNDGTGDYGVFTIIPLPGASFPSTNEGADFNRDGEIDFAAGSGGNATVNVLFGTGGGAFVPNQNLQAGRSVRGLCVGDFNGDGWTDIATANRSGGADGNVTVFLNDGTGRMGAATAIETGAQGETSCAASDANGDGVTDLFIGAFESQEIVLLLGNADGTFTPGARAPSGGTVWMIVAGDLNGDGHTDVLSANNAQDNVGIILGDGRGGLTLDATYPVGDTPLAVDVGDLDGDGDLDAVASNYSSGDFTVYENRGGRFTNPRTLLASTSGSCAILHDRDGDGDLDITGVDEVDDVLILFENRR